MEQRVELDALPMRHLRNSALAACALAAVAACTPDEPPPPLVGYDAIAERGVIRLARQAWAGFDTLPRQGLRPEQYEQIAEQFAERHGLRTEWVVVPGFEDMLERVASGNADIVVAPVTITGQRRQRLLFSEPLTHSREWVIGTSDDGLFGIPAGRAYADTIAEHYPEAEVTVLPGDSDPLDVQNRIEEDVIQASIMDEAAAREVVATSATVRQLRVLPEVKHLAWAMHRDAAGLKTRIDAFLAERHAVDSARTEREVRDWNAIRDAGYLRMVTVTGPTTYYLWRGELLGFEHELMELFARANGLDLEVVVAPGSSELADWLLEGRGDVVSASWFATREREARGLAFSAPYLEVHQTFVTARGPIFSEDHLTGREVVVSAASSQAETLLMMAELVDLRPRLVGHLTDAILSAVAEGTYDVTLVDSHRARLAALFDERLQLGLELEPPRGLAWAVPAGHEGLKRELDGFLGRERRGYDYNVLYNKYFRNERRMLRQQRYRITGDEISPYDEIVRREAEAVADGAIDWRLIVAQMYEESEFDPTRESYAGARGLMQVLPRTALEVGADPERLYEPEINIRAGVRYLEWTWNRFPDLAPGPRLWFALAAYNAGSGHVREARRVARQLGLDQGVWFDNVETAMLKLSEEPWASESMHGYLNAAHPVRYVREIRDRYRAYLDHFRVIDDNAPVAEEEVPVPAFAVLWSR